MPFPQIDRCIVCESVRPEVLGKLAILGFYGIAPNVHISISNFAEPVTLCFFFVGGTGVGHFRANVRVVAPSGAVFQGTEVQGRLMPGKLISFMALTFQAQLPGPGPYHVVLTADGEDRYDTTINLLQGSAEEMARFLGRA
jgi:hypothetical protein